MNEVRNETSYEEVDRRLVQEIALETDRLHDRNTNEYLNNLHQTEEKQMHEYRESRIGSQSDRAHAFAALVNDFLLDVIKELVRLDPGEIVTLLMARNACLCFI